MLQMTVTATSTVAQKVTKILTVTVTATVLETITENLTVTVDDG